MRKLDFSKTYSLRDVLGGYMSDLGENDYSIVVVNADLMGTCRNRSFVERYPERSFNVGIAEQNMISFAAGLAHEGFKPFAFTMAPFISLRACEQVRTDVAYANANVKMIATYAGVSGGISGATHWGIEDCAIMSAMPNMVVMEPCDPVQAKKMLIASCVHKGPVYIRSSVEVIPAIYNDDYEFGIGKATTVRDGNDGTIICSGITVKFAIMAANEIEKATGKIIKIIDMHTIKPLDRQAVIDSVDTGSILVVQDHNIIGGLGYAVANVLAEEKKVVNFKVLGINDEFVAMAHAPYLYKKYHLDAEGIKEEMIALMER